MKKRVKKSLIIFFAVFLAVFSTLTYPAHQAKAGPVVGAAIPAGITIGAGAYTLGALGLAGIVGLAGYSEYEDEINAHAARAWQNGSQLATNSLNASIELAKGAGTGLVNLTSDYISFMESQLVPMSKDITAMVNRTNANGTSISTVYQGVGIYTMYDSTNKAWVLNGNAYKELQIIYNSSLISVHFNYPIKSGLSNLTYSYPSSSSTYITNNANFKKALETNLAADIISAVSAIGLMGTLVNVPEWTEKSISVQSKMRENWETMRDAGLVLPVDSATPHASGKAVNYDANAGTYTGIDGGVVNPADVTWAFPQPKIRVNDVPLPGVYVDTPALTGVPTIDEALIKNPAIPKTTTNVNTGVTIANPDVPITANPIDPSIPVLPDFAKPGSKQITFAPLITSGTAMSNKFPFSIPFDFVKQFQIFNVEPETPVFKVDIPEFLKIGGISIPFRMNLDLSMFELIAEIIRWGTIIAFDIGLIFAIRRLMPE